MVRRRVASTSVLLLIAHGLAGCGSSPVPTAATTTPSTRPSVTAIVPDVGSTDGGTQVRLTGAGLGATVTFGGVAVTGRFDSRYPGALILLATPAHAAGTVDVVVSGQNGQSVTVTSAFTYASPQTFDFNGKWSGYGWNGQDNPIHFTIENNLVLSVECESISSDPGTMVTFSTPRPVTNNEFDIDSDGVRFSGRMVSPSSATGVIRLGECASDGWYANKQ